MIEELIQKYSNLNDRRDYWSGSKFHPLIIQTSDARGVWGEEFIHILLKMAEVDSDWNKDKNVNHNDGGIWDILVFEKIRLEVKTAFRDTQSPKWQHDNIYQEDYWDKIIFVDVDFDKVYITYQNRSDIPFGDDGHKILTGRGRNGGKKSTRHLSAWKFDLNINQIKILERYGFTFTLDINNPDYDNLSKFIKKIF